MKRLLPALLTLLLTLLLAGCAGLGGDGRHFGTGLRIGASVEEVFHVMGEPSLQWQDADGSRQLAYPRGPQGVHTWMLRIGADGRLQGIENVLEQRGFARIARGQTMEQVLRALGPPDPAGTAYFARRDELVWQWRYCEDFGELAHFHVLFDGTTGIVRSTLSLLERHVGSCGDKWGFGGSCRCTR
jgi:hypothetical protein